MKRRELIEMIEEGENLRCEFKLRFSSHEKIAREIIAFANTRGGYLIIGVDDDRNIVGVESEKGEAGLVIDTANNYCEPPVKYTIDYIEIQGKEIVVFEIPESDTKPHRLQDYRDTLDINQAQVFVRVNDKSILASKEMVRILRSQASQQALTHYTIGPLEKLIFEYLDKNETITVKILSTLANISERRASRTLVKMVRANVLMIHTRDNGAEYFSGL